MTENLEFSMSGLTAYVDQQREPLMHGFSLGAPSIDRFEVMSDVYGETNINGVATSVVYADGAACGFNDGSSVTFTDRKIKPADIKIEIQYCANEMAGKFGSWKLRYNTGKTALPFEEDLLKSLMDANLEALESGIWNDINVGGVKKADGLITLAKAVSSAEVTKGSGSDYDNIVKLFNAMPAKMIGEATIYVSRETFRAISQELTAKNLYHYDPKVDKKFELVLPGTDCKLVGVPMNTNVAIALCDKHVVYGVGADPKDIRFWYSEDNDAYRASIHFHAGVNFAFADEVAWMTL